MTSPLDLRSAPSISMIYESSFNSATSTTSTWTPSSVCSVSLQGASLVLSFHKAVSPWTPSKSKPSPKFHLLGIYDNFRVYKAKPTFLDALFLITLYAHMVSFTYYVTTSHFNGTTMPNSRSTTLKRHCPTDLWLVRQTTVATTSSTYQHQLFQ